MIIGCWNYVMLNVKTLSEEFCTGIFAFGVLTKDEATKFRTAALYVLV
jgi:hypothetical protein